MLSRIEKLCKQAQKGDSSAAAELVREFYAKIYAYLRRLCRNQEDAEDLTQETFTRAWSSISDLRDRNKFSSWLYRIAYHAFTDWAAKRGNQVWPDPSWWENLPSAEGNQALRVEQEELAHRLWAAVERLDESKRQAIHLHYYQGLSLRETADVLGVQKSTIIYRLREALNLLHSEMMNDHALTCHQGPITLSDE